MPASSRADGGPVSHTAPPQAAAPQPDNHTFPPAVIADIQLRADLGKPAVPPAVIADLQLRADLGRYPIRGMGARRAVPTFDDLLLLTASASRYPLEGYRERCETRTVLGARNAADPVVLDIPVTIAGMSFGALSAAAKEALGRAATEVGTSTTTGDGGMTAEERAASKTLVYQCLPPPGLDRPRRPPDQDRGTPGGHRLADTHLREDGRHQGLARCSAGRRGRRRSRGSRREARPHSPDTG